MLRIIAGRYGGRRIQAPPGHGTRPTSEKVRGALFNALEQWIELDGARVVDLYAGSGALGIEALSRGVGHVTFVDSGARVMAVVKENLRLLGITPQQADVYPLKAMAWLRKMASPQPVQLVLLDPPYAAGEYVPVLLELAAWQGLAPDAIVVVEAPAKETVPVPPRLEVLRAKRYGDTQLLFLRKSGIDSKIDRKEPPSAREEE